jgi:hypothetical protein
MNKKSNLPEKNFIESITKEELKDITSDVAEAILDEELSDGLFKELPVIGIAFKTFSVFKKINEYFFAKKIFKFLFELKNISQKELDDFGKKMDENDESQKVGEKVLHLLNQSDDIDKASLIGKLFASYITHSIDFDILQRGTIAVNKVFLEDVKSLSLCLSENFDVISETTLAGLLNAGLIIIDGTKDTKYDGGAKLKYKISEIGLLILRFVQ